MTRGSWRSLLFAGTLLALTGAGFGWPAPAWAGCGDYVVFGPVASSAHSQPPNQPLQQAPDSPSPCRGPFCSRGPLSPLLPVASAAVPVEEACPLPTAATFPDPDPSWCRADVSLLRPVERSVSIYHPPRSQSIRVIL